MNHVGTQELTRDEIVRRIDEAARERRRMSAAELLRTFLNGTLEDPGGVGDLLVLTDLLPEDDRLFTVA